MACSKENNNIFGFKTIMRFLFLLTIFFFPAEFVSAESDLKYDDSGFDFGSVGIDFQVQHTYFIFNSGNKAYRIDSLNVTCDCTRVTLSDSLISPGDTVYFHLFFETENYYGPTTKTFTVFTNYSGLQEHKFYYQANVGQWLNGIRPDKESVFLLPGNKKKKISIKNRMPFEVSIIDQIVSDSSYSVNIISGTAVKNELIEFEILPKNNLAAGMYKSTFTIELKLGNKEKTERMSFPIKIVRY